MSVIGIPATGKTRVEPREVEADMRRYFIDTTDGDRYVRDEIGHDLADVGTARNLAMACLPDMARDKLPDGDRRTFAAQIRDETDRVIYKVTLELIGEWNPSSGLG